MSTIAPDISKLTPMQRAWLTAYKGEAAGNAMRAARLAGYKRPQQSGDQVKKRLESLGYLDPEQLSNPEIMPIEQIRQWWVDVFTGAADGGPSGPVPWAQRVKASELLAKSMGGFIDRVEHSTDTGAVRLVLELPDNGRREDDGEDE